MEDSQPETPWEYKPSDTPIHALTPEEVERAQHASIPDLPSDELSPAGSKDDRAITWTASEFIAHDKSFGWYLTLAAVSIFVSALVYLFTRDIISSAVILVAAAAFGIYAGRQPRQLEYSLERTSLVIGGKQYPYAMFRSFAIVDEDAFSSIMFLPLKRFGALTTIYYDPKDEHAIVELLNERLPMEQRQLDMLDRFMKKIRF